MSTLAKLLMGVSGAEPVPTIPGTPFGGGFYAGRIMIDGQAYALVVAPKTQGESGSNLRWKTADTTTVGTDSRNDGWANTQAMLAGGHPAASFCGGLDINGYDDWYLPAQDELEILYRAFKPTTDSNNTSSGANPSAIPPTGNYTISNPSQTNVEVFKQGGGDDFTASVYWSSTQDSSTTSRMHIFTNGSQSTAYKVNSRKVRAVRRVAI